MVDVEEALIKKYILNEKITAENIRLIDETGKQAGIFKLKQALEIAKNKERDLILVSDNAETPVCKLIDFGQFKYYQKKKEKQARRGAKEQVVKELKMGLTISDHDYEIRVKKGREFLTKGFRVKLFIPFKGRQIVHPELGQHLSKRFIESLADVGTPDGGVKNSNRSLVVIFVPK